MAVLGLGAFNSVHMTVGSSDHLWGLLTLRTLPGDLLLPNFELFTV